jgi:hypothetical protein
MKWTAEADLVVGLAFVSGKTKIGVGLGIGRRKDTRSIGLDLGEQLLKRCGVFFVKNSSVASLNWSLEKHSKVCEDREKAMKRSNVFNMLLQMMPSANHSVEPSSPDHWAFLVTFIGAIFAPKNSRVLDCNSSFGDEIWISFFRNALYIAQFC